MQFLFGQYEIHIMGNVVYPFIQWRFMFMACSRQDTSGIWYQFSKMVKSQWEIWTETCLVYSAECFAEKVDIVWKGYRGALMCSHHHMWISKCITEDRKQKVTLCACKIWKLSWFSFSICFFRLHKSGSMRCTRTCGTCQIKTEHKDISYVYVSHQRSNLKEQAQEQEKIKMYATRIVCMDKEWT
jgi:hypothetical protein